MAPYTTTMLANGGQWDNMRLPPTPLTTIATLVTDNVSRVAIAMTNGGSAYDSDSGPVYGGSGAFGSTDMAINATIVQPVFTFNWNVTNKNNSYFIVITMLSLAVVMAVLFTLFGLFMKAGAYAFTLENLDTHAPLTHERMQMASSNANLLKADIVFMSDE